MPGTWTPRHASSYPYPGRDKDALLSSLCFYTVEGRIHSFCPTPMATLPSAQVGRVSLKPLVMLKRNLMYGGVNTDVYHQTLQIINESYLSFQTVQPGILMPRLGQVPFTSCGWVPLSLFSVWALETG